MLFLRMLCSIVEEPFERFSDLNKQKTDLEYEAKLYEVVKFGERNGLEKELSIIVGQLSIDPDIRLSPEKLYNTIQSECL
jgi:hypothetical protein